jgi:hypothetical protein
MHGMATHCCHGNTFLNRSESDWYLNIMKVQETILKAFVVSHFIDLAKNKILLILEKHGHSDCPTETI